MSAWLTVLGIGEDGAAGLTPAARTLIDTAEVIAGGARHLDLVADMNARAERLRWRSPLAASLKDLEARRGKRLVVLASGDPMHFGIGATLAREFGPDALAVMPAPSSFSLAAARLGWALQTTRCLSLHGRPESALRLYLAPGVRLLALTEDGAAPARIAALLKDSGWGASVFTVFENLGGRQERRLHASAETWSEPEVATLNTLAIECRPGPDARLLSRAAGLPDDVFRHDGQITKRDLRALTLAKLAPLPDETLWDIGAGAGSIAIEWLRSAPTARAFAIEREERRRANIAFNADRLGAPQLAIVGGDAPAALADLPAPDAVFIGGGLATPGVIATSWQALSPNGRLVANAVTLEGEAALLGAQARLGGVLTRIAIAQAEPLGEFAGWRAQMPVTQWHVLKAGN